MTSGVMCVEIIGVCLILLKNYVRKTPPPLITSLSLYDVTMLASCWNAHKSMTNANTARTHLNTLTNTHLIMSLCAHQEVSSLSLFLHLYIIYKRYSPFCSHFKEQWSEWVKAQSCDFFMLWIKTSYMNTSITISKPEIERSVCIC